MALAQVTELVGFLDFSLDFFVAERGCRCRKSFEIGAWV